MKAVIFRVGFYTDLRESITMRPIDSTEEHHIDRYGAWAFKEGKNQVVDTGDDLVELKAKWGEAPVYTVEVTFGDKEKKNG